MFRKIIKKLNNFKFTSLIVACGSILTALYTLSAIFCYHFAGDLDPQSKGLVRKVGFTNTPKGQYIGMVFFLGALVALFISIFVAYSLIPFIRNKEKLNPRKGLLLANFVNTLFVAATIVFMILLVTLKTEDPNTAPAIITCLPFGFIALIANGLQIIPFLNCDFYMPEIKKD